MQAQLLNYDDYLRHTDGTDTRYELVQGRLVEMKQPTTGHLRITKFLERKFDVEIGLSGLPWEAFREAGQRTSAGVRLPDVVVVPLKAVNALIDQPIVFKAPALLVVEVVSTSTWRDDHVEKLKEYEAIGVPEYWVVDYLAVGVNRCVDNLQLPTVSIYQLVDGAYQLKQFRGEQMVESPTLKVGDSTIC
ncbi:MAG: Uma2 family endonuclease, partial [Leptolyngbya sp. SIO4C1]|nr:Uma2 family endonuclease [Leptolyngbya sp. SIO4C1]